MKSDINKASCMQRGKNARQIYRNNKAMQIKLTNRKIKWLSPGQRMTFTARM